MPTDIPVPPKTSWTVEAAAILLGSLLAAAIISAIAFAIVWAYTVF